MGKFNHQYEALETNIMNNALRHLDQVATQQDATSPSLEQQRREFSQRRFMAMPIAGTIVWTIIGIVGALMSDYYAVWSIWIGCGSIFYLGAGIAHFMGEGFFQKRQYKNVFDSLFMSAVSMALLIFAIAMPFAAIDHTSVPLTVGILAGIMWIPFSWIVQHWVGWFHAIARTFSVLGLWYLLPDYRFVAIPAAIVFIYLISLVVLARRYRSITVAK